MTESRREPAQITEGKGTAMQRYLLALATFVGLALLAWWLVPTSSNPGEPGDKPSGRPVDSPAQESIVTDAVERPGKQSLKRPLTVAAFSPDGKYVVAGDQWERVTLWDAPLGHKLWEADTTSKWKRERHPTGFTAVAFSADGKRVITGSEDGAVHLWDAANGKELLFVDGVKEQGKVRAAALTIDGREILAAYDTGLVAVWDAAHGKLLRSFQQTTGGGTVETARLWWRACGGSLSPTGRYVLDVERAPMSAADCALRLWEVTSGRQVLRCPTANRVTPRAVLLSDSRRVLTGGNGVPAVWDLVERRRIRFFAKEGPWRHLKQLVASPDSKKALLMTDEELVLWDLEADEELCTLEWRFPWPEGIRCLAMSPNCKRLLGRLRGKGPDCLWDTLTGKVIRRLPHGVITANFLPNGAALLGFYDNTLAIWDVERGRKIQTLDCPKVSRNQRVLIYSVALSLDGRWAAADGELGGKLWSTTTGKRLPGLAELYRCGSPRFSPDNKRIVGMTGKGVGVWDVATGKLLRQIKAAGNVYRFALSQDGHWAVINLNGKPGEVWDVESGKRIRLLSPEEKSDTWEISPDGSLLLCLNRRTQRRRITDLRTGKLIRELPLRRVAKGMWVGFSPQGELLWSEYQGPRFRFYDPRSGREVYRGDPLKAPR